MPNCPICAQPLETVRQREGLFHHCLKCDGRALTIPQLRRVTGDKFATKLLRLLRLARRRSELACPFCTGRLLPFEVSEPQMQLHGCTACVVVWFDAPTYELMPEGSAEFTNSLPALATQIFAESRLKELQEREAEAEEEAKQKRKKKSP